MAFITVVEDSPSIAEVIRAKLTSEGHEVAVFADGQEGLDALRAHPPELLVLDVNLPSISGFEVARQVREDSTLQNLPILMLTAQADLESRLQGLEFADDYLSKPFSLKELQARITALLRRSQFMRSQSLNLYDLSGQTLRHYRLQEIIGQGGMSVVYKAHDERLNRTVALKFFTELMKASEPRERFMREAQTASSLEHPNICTVFTVDETEEGHLFMVMPCLEGETLEEELKRGAFDIKRAITLALLTLRGLRHAHAQNVVHRDVKPANLFLTLSGQLKLLDFGVAKWRHTPDNLTKPGTLLGTINYMSPEQLRSREVDARTDLWAIGVVLFEMLTGERPFRTTGDIITTINAIAHETPPLVGELRGGMPVGLESIVARALEKDPAERYASADAFMKDLMELKL